MSIDTTDEALKMRVEAVRESQYPHTEPIQALGFIKWAAGNMSQELTDFVGMTGGSQSQGKGLFTRTTYADRLENETEYGWCNTADRIMRNILRNWEDVQG